MYELNVLGNAHIISGNATTSGNKGVPRDLTHFNHSG